jgi:hypothetical protein
VNGEGPGAVLDLPSSGAVVQVRAEARSLVPFERLELIAGGRVLARADAGSSPPSAVLEAEAALPEGGWLLARCVGPYAGQAESWVAAVTSPVYVRVEGRPPRPPAATAAALRGHLERMLDWVERKGRFENDQQRQRLAGVFQSALHALPAQGTWS